METLNFFMKELEKRGAEDIVLKAEKTHNYQIKFYNSKIDIVKEYDFSKILVFATKGRKTILTSVKAVDKKSLTRKASEIVKFLSMLPDSDYRGIADGPFKYRSNKNMASKEAMNIPKAIKMCEDAISTAVNNGGTRVAGVLEGSVTDEELISNHNVKAKQKETQTYLSIRVLTDHTKGTSSGHMTSIARNLKDLKAKDKSEQAAEISLQGVKTRKIPVGKYDIIYYPLASASIIENIGDAASIFNVETQSSCFINKLGKKVANEKVTISDDPTNNKIPGSSLFDDEGVPTKRNRIIDKGVFKKYLHNTSTAKKYKTKTTANAGLPMPEATSTKLHRGDSSIEEMIRTTKKGLLITNTWYTRFQSYIKGDFSTIPRDSILIIKNGKISGATTGIRLNDNLIRLMSNIELLDRKVEPIAGWETERINQIPIFKVKNVLVTRPK